MAARRILSEQGAIPPEQLIPTYLRPSQAERDKAALKKRQTDGEKVDT